MTNGLPQGSVWDQCFLMFSPQTCTMGLSANPQETETFLLKVYNADTEAV